MTRNVKISIGIAGAFFVLLAAALVVGASNAGKEQNAEAAATEVVRADSHRLSTAKDGKVTLVEFLDFECEACGAAFPLVEQLREDYDGRVTFVTRYFPLPSHSNAQNAAIAVEAAAQQGEFEAMYKKMFETQTQWGEQQGSEAGRFRGFAQELGLDMTKFDAAVADPATLERVKSDVADGEALGVESTPTFFLNGEKITIQSEADLRSQIDEQLAS